MRILTILVFALAVAVPHAKAQADHQVSGSRPNDTIEEIKALEEARNQAVLHGDVVALDRMTSEDYTFVTLRGELRTKSDILKGFSSGSFKYESRQISDLNVRVYGDTAVVTGRSVQKGVENGKDYSGAYWFTRVYVKQKGRWLTVRPSDDLDSALRNPVTLSTENS
jgi:ketosteroid isomerase-like protein